MPNINILGGRIIVCVKNVDKHREMYEARIIAQDHHRGIEKALFIHESETLWSASLRLIL